MRCLALPVDSVASPIWSLQYIIDLPESKNQKRFHSGGRMSGCFHLIGYERLHHNVLVLCEGFSTGISLYMALCLPVLCCMNAGNLVTVAKQMKRDYPHYRHIIAADNDHKTEQNIGISKANEASRYGGRVVIPDLSESDKASGLTDFNDLHCHHGLESIITQFTPILEKMGIQKNILKGQK